MYNGFFGFSQSPFASAPLAQHYFPAATIEAARAKLARCAERAEGIGLVVGRSGLGKTLLCHVLRDGFRSRFQVALLAAGRLGSRRTLLQALLYCLGKPYRGMDEGDLRLSLLDCLSDTQQFPNGVILLVDEADVLPLRLLDEIRLFTNLAIDGKPRLRPILAGACRLEERLNSPRLESFNQRIVARCYLEPFTRSETQQYIHTRIKAAGGSAEHLFPAESCRAIHVATDGVPRLVNQLCDQVLLLAYVGGRRCIEPPLVEEAWQDLQQLPVPTAPGNAPCQDSPSVIEFGQLDDPADGTEQRSPDRPELRIVAETDAASTTPCQPAVRLAAIEGLVEHLHEEFRPAGTIKPEVELVFGDDEFPLAQQFEEEELVDARVCPLRQIHSISQQNQAALPADLGSADQPSGDPGLQSEAPTTQPHQPAKDPRQIDTVAPATSWAPLPAGEPRVQPGDGRGEVELAGNRKLIAAATMCALCGSGHRPAGENGAQPDAPIQFMPAPPTCAIVPLRQRRFGRLFSTLKWG